MNKDMDPTMEPTCSNPATLSTEKPIVQPPLPSEILALSDAETACQFCGISYLLLARMETLQKEFQRLEKELEERKAFAGQKAHYEQLLAERESRIDLFTEQSQNYQKEVLDLKRECYEQQTQLQMLKEAWSKQRTQFNNALQWHTKTLYQTKKLHSAFRPLLLEWKHLKDVTRKEMLDLQESIHASFSECIQQYRAVTQAQMQVKEKELSSLVTQVKDLQSQLQDMHAHQQSQAAEHVRHLAQNQEKYQQDQILWNQQLEQLQKEKQGYIVNLTLQEKEYQALHQSLHAAQTQHQSMYKRLETQLIESQQTLEREKKTSEQYQLQLQHSQAQLKLVEDALALERSTQFETESQTEKSSQLLQRRLKQAEMQRDALAKERESMVHAHQHRIKDLQDTFQERYQALRQSVQEQSRGEWDKEQQAWLEKERRHHVQLQQCQAALEEWKQQVQQLQGSWQRKISEWEQHKNKWEAQRLQLEDQHRTLQTELNASQERVRALETELDAARMQAQRASTHDASLAEYEALRARDCAAHQQELDMLRETIRQECEERLKLTSTLESLQGAPPAPVLPTATRGSSSGTAVSPRSASVPAKDAEVCQFEAKLMAATQKKRKNIQARANPYGQGEWHRL